MNIFELNDISVDQVDKEYLLGSPIFSVRNFYKYPEKVHQFIFDEPYREGRVGLWKINESGSNNGIYFEDRRFYDFEERLIDAYFFLCDLIGDYHFRSVITTNMTLFKTDDNSLKFNNFKDNYWWPHVDTGYNGIVYFNTECGTNLYEPNCLDYSDKNNEHEQPWRSKENYNLLKTIQPEYNKLVLFDGCKFPHGMNIDSDRYFGKKTRNNQVFFFEDNLPENETQYYCV